MPFSQEVKTKAMVACGRFCVICHKFCGNNMEVHHIVAESDGGSNNFDNAIPLCFDCHAEVRQYDPKHPKGIRFTKDELIQHRDNWYKKVSDGVYHADGNEKAIYKEDIELFHSICELFTPSVKCWLIENDIGGSHPYTVFQGLSKYLYGIDDPFSEFIDTELEKLRGNLISSINKFLAYKATNTFVRDFGGEKHCVTREWMINHEDWIPHSMDYEEYSVQYAEEAQKLNDLATDVWDTYCEFARQGRYRLAQRQ